MANLNKLFIHVPSSLCEQFRLTYVTGGEGVERKKDYDEKICFLEDTQEIFTQGKIYGTNVQDFNALKTLVGKLPEGVDSTNIVDFIEEFFRKSTLYIDNVAIEIDEKLLKARTDTDSNSYTKIAYFVSSPKLRDAVSYAENAVQSLSILGKTLNKNTTSISVEEAKSYLTLGSAAFKDVSYFDLAGAASAVAAKLPVVVKGSGIEVGTSTDENGKTTYTISTSASVWHYKGNKPTKQDLPSSGNVTGDVWSVGPANTPGSELYVWDGNEWINIGPADDCVHGVDGTPSQGVKLDFDDKTKKVKVVVTLGEIESGNDSVVTGGKVYSYIQANCDPKGAADAVKNDVIGTERDTYENNTIYGAKYYADTVGERVEAEIPGIDITSSHGVNLDFDTETKQVKVVVNPNNSDNNSVTTVGSVNSKISDLKTNLETQIRDVESKANKAVSSITGDTSYLNVSNTGTSYSIDLDETKVFNYVTDNIWDTFSV